MNSFMSHSDGDEFSLHTAPVGDELGTGEELPDLVQDHRPRLLIMGLRRKVCFCHFLVVGLIFLILSAVSSTGVGNQAYRKSFIDFQVWDFPGQIDYFDPAFDSNVIFGEYGALIFVIDAQDDYIEALQRLHQTVTRACRVNPELTFEVFIHKVDALSDEYKLDTQRDIQQRTTDELADEGLENAPISFYLTSIYDHSIFEAFSKVIQKLIPQMPTLENLLNILCSNSGIEKAFLFDVNSKIYIATDSSPVDIQSYEICSDMIDVIIDISEIYGRTNTYRFLTNDAYSDDKASSINTAHNAATITNGESSSNYGTITETADEAASVIKLNNGMVLCLRGVNRFLALVCLLRADHYEKHGLIEYNFHCFKQAIAEVFELKRRNFERYRQERLRITGGGNPGEDNTGG
ncbi:5670_t:CDS:2 [Ambispora gerdemannii]|uniref:GTP-binding protein n=1 Tax=Ambispora gerdemannii TaxID=144530 RepID=A0A9N8W1W5_9GLOM|nr:5670_t:CDS:2 [Ambispora gerdemannii]